MTSVSENAVIAQTLQRDFQKGEVLFLQKQYSAAHKQFQDFYLIFGQEPELKEKTTAEYIFSLMGYAAFFSGDNDSTRSILTDYFSKNQEYRTAQTLFMRFLLAQACADAQDFSSAAENFALFRQAAGNHVFRDIAAIQEARMLYKTQSHDAALTALDNVARNSSSELIKIRARLLMLHIAMDANDFFSAGKILLETRWNLESTPEIISLSLSALRIGSKAFKEGKYNLAASCYRLTTSPSRLLRLQEERYTALKTVFDARKHQVATSAGGLLWIQLYNDLLHDSKAQIDYLKSLALSDGEIKLQTGQALLFDQQYLLAEACFTSMIHDETISASLREQSFYRLIVAFQTQEKWDEALDYGNRFIQSFPTSKHLPEVLALNAYTFQAKNEFLSAQEIYNYLLSHFSTHSSAPQWLYSRAMNSARMNHYSESQKDFENFMKQYPKHLLVDDAKFWRALCMHFQKQYKEAIAAFDSLLKEEANHKLSADITFRKAQSHYAIKDYPRVLDLTDSFSKLYPGHHLIFENHILRGNTLATIGKSEAAKDAYAKVTIDQKELYSYVQFQIGKIFKTEKDFLSLQKHYETYVIQAESEKLPRCAEAIYWIGFSLIQQGEPEKAIWYYLDSLRHFGNHLDFNESFLLFAQLEKLRKSYFKENAESFDNWLAEEANNAFKHNETTYWGRIKTYHAQRLRNHDSSARSQVILLELYDSPYRQSFDAQTLSEIALTLHQLHFSQAKALFTEILEKYPQSPYRSAAYYGMADLAFAQNDLEQCNYWFERFETETPFAQQRFEMSFLRIQYLAAKNDFESATNNANALLKEKRYRGRQHARILLFLAEMSAQQNTFQEAIAYCQRIYTLYPAFENERDKAYILSAEYFMMLRDYDASRKTLEEFLRITEKSYSGIAQEEKRQKAKILLSSLPERQQNP